VYELEHECLLTRDPYRAWHYASTRRRLFAQGRGEPGAISILDLQGNADQMPSWHLISVSLESAKGSCFQQVIALGKRVVAGIGESGMPSGEP
jgi:hypothetical protein